METIPIPIKYGEIQIIKVNLYNTQGTALINGVALTAADFNIQIDSQAVSALSSVPTTVALGYEISLTALESTGESMNIQAVEAAGNNFIDAAWILQTTGHPLAKFPFVNLDTGTIEGFTSGVPTNVVIPTTITSESYPNAFEGRIVTWQDASGTYPQGRILSNTAGVNTTITLQTAKAANIPTGARILVL